MIGIIIDDQATIARLTTLANQLEKPEAMAKVVGREGVNQLKKHFRLREQDSPNKLGGTRQHFWRQVAQSVSSPTITEGGRSIHITVSHDGFGQKLHGGTITAKRGKALTIPVTAEAYGRRASTLEHEKGIKLFVIHHKGESAGFGLLAAKDSSGNVTVHYLLRRSVTQSADLRAMPERNAFLAALVARAEAFVERITSEQAGGTPEA